MVRDLAAGNFLTMQRNLVLVDHSELEPVSDQLHIVLAEIYLYEQCNVECEQQLKRWHGDNEVVRKLDEISGIGLLTTSVLKNAVGKPERFASGRQLSVWLGMTPRELRSGERGKLGHTRRQGNVYVRTLLIHSARAALLAAQRCQVPTQEKLTQLQSWAAVALVNQLVLIRWAVRCHERHFSVYWQRV